MSTERQLHTINIAVTLKSPWLVNGNEPGNFGLDAALMRNHQGRPILPGTLIQGRLRHAWQEMAKDFGLKLPDLDTGFGKGGNEFEHRGRILVDDLVADLEKESEEFLMNTRVPIDFETGAAKQGGLLIMEQICLPGTPITFSGSWRVWATESEAIDFAKQIQNGLNWLSQLGAQRSVGFGQIENVAVNVQKSSLRLLLSFNIPICVEAKSRGNTFISGDVITGGTIKGAIATLLRQKFGKSVAELKKESNMLAKHFDALRITHALPSIGAKRPSALPLSLASVGDEIFELASINGPQLINNQAPTFFHDWKGATWRAVHDKRGWGNTGTHLRVRTAINAESRTAAESKLFAYECRVPSENTRWLADISLAAIPEDERQQVIKALTELLQHGLGPIGKTDAWADVAFTTDHSNVWGQEAVTGNTVTVQLNTPALLISSRQIAKETNPILKTIYTDLFSELSDNTLTLSHYYTSHSMAGGGFLHGRQKPIEPNYQPYVLTDAGSVFVFTINDLAKAKNILEHWQAQGLPLPTTVVEERSTNWQHNPYLPQNGYGEIAINLRHGFRRPKAEQLTAVGSL